ncbi:MAG: hypothetical protein U0K80_01185 [Methanobrevibacter sp.]|nr:hypothetical protein [Methanobrevibacter sp.]
MLDYKVFLFGSCDVNTYICTILILLEAFFGLGDLLSTITSIYLLLNSSK